MIWEGGPGGKVWLGRGGSVICVDKFLLDGGSIPIEATVVDMTESGVFLYNNYALTLTELYLGDAVIASGSAAVSVASEVEVIPTGDVSSVTDIEPDAEMNRQPYGAVHDITNIIPDSLNGVTIADVANSVLGVVQLTSYVVFAHSGGLVVVNKGTRQVHSFVTYANVTCIAYFPGWIYFGTSDGGVRRMLESSLLTAGDRSAFTALQYGTGTSPSIDSNNITGIDGSGVSLAIATDSSVEYVPDHAVATIYNMSQAGVTDCAVSATILAYIVSGQAYAIAVPTGNWSFNAADLSGIKTVGASTEKTYTTEIVGNWASVAGAAGDFIVSGDSGNSKQLYSIDPVTKALTLVHTFTSTWNEGSSPHPQVRGDYIFSYGKTGERKLIVMKINNSDQIEEIYVQASSAWPSDTSAEKLIVNEAGTVAIYPRGDAGTYQTVTPPPRYSVEYWYLHNRSGDTVTGPYTREFPNDLSIIGMNPAGTYLVGMTNGGTPAGGEGPTYGIGFCSMSTGLAVTVNPPRYSVLSGVFIGNLYLATKERVDVAGEWQYYIVLYSIAGTSLTYRDEVFLGPLSDAGSNIYRYFTLYSYDNQLFLDIYHTVWIGDGLAREGEVRQYAIVNNKLKLAVNSLDTGETTDRSSWLGPYGSVSNGWSLARVNDYDLETQTSLGTLITLQQVDFTTTEKAYTSANTVEAEGDTFIGTSEGLFVENLSTKLAPRLIADKLQPITNVVALEPSAGADEDTGVVAYATSDGTDGFAGVVDLEE